MLICIISQVNSYESFDTKDKRADKVMKATPYIHIIEYWIENNKGTGEIHDVFTL